MQEPSKELELLLNAAYQVTIGFTDQNCPMFNTVRNTYGDSFCNDTCPFAYRNGKCKIRLLNEANFTYRTSLLKEREVAPYIPGNKDNSDPTEELEILDPTEVCI